MRRLPAARLRSVIVSIALACVCALAPVLPAAASVAAPPRTFEAPAAPADMRATPLPSGTTALVRGDGDCVRLRIAPSLGSAQLACMPDGATLAVLDGQRVADGYRWQQVTWSGRTGWAADAFLAPYQAAASAPSCGATSTQARAGLSGPLPTGGGYSFVVWGGGTLAGLETASRAQGCRPSSVWASQPGGGLVRYVFGAPAIVNAPWVALFADGRIPAGTPLIIACGGAETQAARIGGPPAPSGAAPSVVGSARSSDPDATAWALLDGTSGAVLAEHDGATPLPPASVTKIATAIVAIEGSDLSQWVRTNVDSRAMPDSSVLGLLPGDCFTMRDLLYGMLLPSGNDAALAIARYVAGSDEAFVAQMNALLDRLGLHDSHFTDPHGLGSATHLASARDLAALARYAMTLQEFRQVVHTPSYTTSGSRALSMVNGNRLLGSYDGADGVKTGFTETAGPTLVASATRNGHQLFAALLNAPSRFTDAAKLFDWAFSAFRWP